MKYLTKGQVRDGFKYSKQLMVEASKMMKDKSITDFSNDSEIGQLANELIGCASIFQMWLDEQTHLQNEAQLKIKNKA